MKGLNTSKGAARDGTPEHLQITTVVKIETTAEDKLALDLTRENYTKSCNFLWPYAKTGRCSNYVKLHHAAYYDLKAEFPDLGSQHKCNVIRHVAGIAKAMHTQASKCKDEKKAQEMIDNVVFKNPCIHLDANTITYDPEMATATINVAKKGRKENECTRITVNLNVNDYQRQQLALGEVRESNLKWHYPHKGKPGYYALHITILLPPVTQSFASVLKESDVMGVDVGENNIAATSTNKIYKAGKLKDTRDRALALRKRLQSNGSQSAKQALKKLSGRERRYVTHVNHEISRKIVNEAIRTGAKVIALEDLTNIRERIKAGKRVRARLHRWPFRQLQTFIVYKAAMANIRCVFVDPHYTSQTCSRCHNIGKRVKNRFTCDCAPEKVEHSDVNASRNIAFLGYRQISQGLK